MIFVESGIRLDFTDALSAKKFDGPQHGLSHCMKAVDFVVEMPDYLLFVEVKDPQHPEAGSSDARRFISKLRSGNLIKGELVPKARDSYLYEHATGRLRKPVHYLVLIALDTLSPSELIFLTDLLRSQIPVDGPPANPWPHKFIHGCLVLNLAAWNSRLPQFPASRVVSSAP